MGFFFSNFMTTMVILPSIFVGFNLQDPNVKSCSFFEVFKKQLLAKRSHLYSEIKFVTNILRKTLEGNLQHACTHLECIVQVERISMAWTF
jgi:hypothetical protein